MQATEGFWRNYEKIRSMVRKRKIQNAADHTNVLNTQTKTPRADTTANGVPQKRLLDKTLSGQTKITSD